MKIVIKSQERTYRIILPNGLILNRLTVGIACKVIKTWYPSYEISRKDAMNLARVIKKYKHTELVDIKSIDGEHVYIKL